MRRKLVYTIVTPILVVMLLFASVSAGAEGGQTDTELLMQTLKDPQSATEEHIIWEPIMREVEDAKTQAAYIQPEDGDLDQEEALRIALDTVFAVTDLKMDTIFNAYQITFSFNLAPIGEQRFWTVNFDVGIGKMAGPSYKVEVASPSGALLLFEDTTT